MQLGIDLLPFLLVHKDEVGRIWTRGYAGADIMINVFRCYYDCVGRSGLLNERLISRSPIS